jgi:hypothetical protein
MPSDTSSPMSEVPSHIRRAGADAEALYAKLMSAGYGHKWAEMCALQTPPGTQGSDRTYMEGRLNNQQLDRMPKDHAQRIVAAARKAGINPSGKYYAAGLADKRGAADPMAWVDSTADVRRVAQVRNLTVEGAVNHRGTPVPPKRKALSDRLVNELMTKERAAGSQLKDGELREKVIDKYAYKKGKR